jgi:hypothetical protein
MFATKGTLWLWLGGAKLRGADNATIAAHSFATTEEALIFKEEDFIITANFA